MQLLLTEVIVAAADLIKKQEHYSFCFSAAFEDQISLEAQEMAQLLGGG